MKDSRAQQLIDQILKHYKEHGFDVPALSDMLMDLRAVAIDVKDPMITKILRLTAEHMKEYGQFQIKLIEDDQDGDMTNFEYMLHLVRNSENKFNREELSDLRNMLLVYPEPVVTEDDLS